MSWLEGWGSKKACYIAHPGLSEDFWWLDKIQHSPGVISLTSGKRDIRFSINKYLWCLSAHQGPCRPPCSLSPNSHEIVTQLYISEPHTSLLVLPLSYSPFLWPGYSDYSQLLFLLFSLCSLCSLSWLFSPCSLFSILTILSSLSKTLLTLSSPLPCSVYFFLYIYNKNHPLHGTMEYSCWQFIHWDLYFLLN